MVAGELEKAAACVKLRKICYLPDLYGTWNIYIYMLICDLLSSFDFIWSSAFMKNEYCDLFHYTVLNKAAEQVYQICPREKKGAYWSVCRPSGV